MSKANCVDPLPSVQRVCSFSPVKVILDHSCCPCFLTNACKVISTLSTGGPLGLRARTYNNDGQGITDTLCVSHGFYLTTNICTFVRNTSRSYGSPGLKYLRLLDMSNTTDFIEKTVFCTVDSSTRPTPSLVTRAFTFSRPPFGNPYGKRC